MDIIIAHGRLQENLAKHFFRQIISAIDYCHAHHVIHRDLKAENILLDGDFRVKIIDFGLSNYFVPGENMKTFCGSPTYTAPELIQRKEYEGPNIDIWSMGVVLYVLVCGQLPFDGTSYLDLFTKILTCKYTIPDELNLSSECKDLISKMLVVDPNERIKIDGIRTHQWALLNNEPVPKELSPIQNETIEIDYTIIEKLKEIGYDPEQTIKDVQFNSYTDSASTYFLLLAKREQLKTEETLDDIYQNQSQNMVHSPKIKGNHVNRTEKNKGHRRRKNSWRSSRNNQEKNQYFKQYK